MLVIIVKINAFKKIIFGEIKHRWRVFVKQSENGAARPAHEGKLGSCFVQFILNFFNWRICFKYCFFKIVSNTVIP